MIKKYNIERKRFDLLKWLIFVSGLVAGISYSAQNILQMTAFSSRLERQINLGTKYTVIIKGTSVNISQTEAAILDMSVYMLYTSVAVLALSFIFRKAREVI